VTLEKKGVGVNQKEIGILLDNFIHERNWGQFHNPKNLAISIAVEAGELLELYQWQDKADLKRVEDEIADIYIYLVMLADYLLIDIGDAALRKIEKNREKYPVEKARGNARKYDQL
jgi:NTP pyrophosphatase (non-canonical NTP hydrolase)